MISVVLLAALTAVDPQVQAYIDAGKSVPNAEAGAFKKEFVTQVDEFNLMAQVRQLQESLTQAELDVLAADLTAEANDPQLPWEARRRAWFSACHLQRSQTLPLLIAASASGPLPLRVVATMCLGRYGDYDLRFHRELHRGVIHHVEFQPHPALAAYEPLIAAAQAKEPEIRAAAWSALYHFKTIDFGLVKHAIERKETDPTFLEMLANDRHPEVIRYLLSLSHSPNVEVRRAVSSALKERTHAVKDQVYVALVADPDDVVSSNGVSGLRKRFGLPLELTSFSVDRTAMEALIARRLSPDFKPVEIDKTMPPSVDEALALRKQGKSVEAADRLRTIAKKAAAAKDWRTEAIALHRAGDAYADVRDCNAAIDAYGQALVMHELRGDFHFAAVASNDFGLLWFRCGWHIGSWSPDYFRYTVTIRRATGDKVALRQALNNYAVSLLGTYWLDPAAPVIAEALELAQEQNDKVAERKAVTNEADRQALYCTELTRLKVKHMEGDGLEMPKQCLIKPDGSIGFTPEAEKKLRAQVQRSWELAQQTGVGKDELCTVWPDTVGFLCDWLKQLP